LNQLIATRVAEALVAAVVTHAPSTQEETNLGSNSSQNKTCNYKEFRAVMHESFREGDIVKFASSTLLDGALTWWNVYVRSVTLDTAHATPWSDFKAMFIRKYWPRNEIKQMENELWNLKVKGTNLTAYNQHFQELILLFPKMVPNADRLLERYIEGLPLNMKVNVTSSKPVDLHEAIDMAQGLMYQVVQELGENSGDKRKWNGNHYTHNPNNTNNTSNLNPNKCPETARVFSAGQVDLHEAIDMAQGLMYQVVQELGENSGDKRKWNGNHYTHNPNNTNNTSNLNPNKCPETARVFSAGQGHKAKDCRALPHPQTKEDQEAKEDMEAMSLVLDVTKKDITRTSVRTMRIKAVEIISESTNQILRTIRGRIKETLREIAKHQPVLKGDAEHLAEYTIYVLKLR
ncbi:reverse transcriptase domain-containing protein, partial [Tanacetum coccineum]